MTRMTDREIEILSQRRMIGDGGPGRRFWEHCNRMAKGEFPEADSKAINSVVARKATQMLFACLLRDLTARPEDFTASVAAMANGFVAEVGDNLAAFPFEERVRAFEGLSRALAASLQIAVDVAPRGDA